jgi:SPP1 gp7 family putative phage head morphogenesis protein
MANPVTTLLESINHEVAKLSTTGLSKLTSVLDAAEKELTQDLASWAALGRGEDVFTPQMYRNALLQIRGTLEHIRGPVAEGVASSMRHGGVLAAHLATKHLEAQVTTFSAMFEGSIRPIAIEAASILADGSKTVWPKFSNSAKRYAGQVGEDIRKQLAIGVVRGETVDQLTARLSRLGGPKGLVYTRGQEGSPGAKAEYISEGLFNRYRHYAERLVVTETVNAYNSFALDGMDELEKEDPGYFKRWDAAIDKRTCDFCGRYDDLVVKLDAKFPGGIDHPPLHPRCRCAVVVWRKEWDESNHKDDLIGETIKGSEPKGVAAIPHQIDLLKSEKPKKKAKVATPKKRV